MAAGGEALLTVTAPELGIYPSYGTSIEGAVVVTTDAFGDTPHRVAVTQATRGAVVRFIDDPFFVEAPAGVTASFDVHLHNGGNLATSLTLVTSIPELTLDRGDVALGPNETVTVRASYTPTAASVRREAFIGVDSGGGCRVPDALVGTVAPADAGLSVDTSSLVFGPTLCATAPAPQFVVLRNSGVTASVRAEIVGAEAGFSLAAGARERTIEVGSGSSATLPEVAAAPDARTRAREDRHPRPALGRPHAPRDPAGAHRDRRDRHVGIRVDRARRRRGGLGRELPGHLEERRQRGGARPGGGLARRHAHRRGPGRHSRWRQRVRHLRLRARLVPGR